MKIKIFCHSSLFFPGWAKDLSEPRYEQCQTQMCSNLYAAETPFSLALLGLVVTQKLRGICSSPRHYYL